MSNTAKAFELCSYHQIVKTLGSCFGHVQHNVLRLSHSKQMGGRGV